MVLDALALETRPVSPAGSAWHHRVAGLHWTAALCRVALTIFVFTSHFCVWTLIWAEGQFFHLAAYTVYGGIFGSGVAIYEARSAHRRSLPVGGIVVAQREAFRATAWGLLALLVWIVATKDQAISRTFLFSFAPVVYLALLPSYRWLPECLANRFHQGAQRRQRTILVGSAARLERLQGWLRLQFQLGLDPVAWIQTVPTGSDGTDEDEVGTCARDRRAEAVPFRGDVIQTTRLADLPALLREKRARQVLLLGFCEGPASELPEIAQCCVRSGAGLTVVSDLEERLRQRVHFENSFGTNLISLLSEPLENPFHRVAKRALDLAVAGCVAVLILPPVALVVWTLHRLHSPGPLLHCQKRSGLYNRRFVIYKFRTMRHRTGRDREQGRQAGSEDDRFFPGARWLRRFSLDELPQCLNVLAGTMSVVGPRPHLIQHDRRFAAMFERYYVRTRAKPGITGLAQVRGLRGAITDPETLARRIESDLEYIEHWSITLDLVIIMRTAVQVVWPPQRAV